MMLRAYFDIIFAAQRTLLLACPLLPIPVRILHPDEPTPLLEVEHLTISAGALGRPLVDALSFRLSAGETLAVVGESGAGKSLTGLAVLGLLPAPLRLAAGRIRWQGREISGLSESARRHLRGGEMAMIFQEPSAAMNPAIPIGPQIAEVVRMHRNLDRREARARAIELLDRVHIADPAQRYHAYPHELSGGMLQRAAIAVAIAGEPRLLIADEPTTSLDAAVQRGVLELLAEIQSASRMGMLFITHNLALVAEMADRALVMRAGCAVEQADVCTLFAQPEQPYTRELLAAAPRLPAPCGA